MSFFPSIPNHLLRSTAVSVALAAGLALLHGQSSPISATGKSRTQQQTFRSIDDPSLGTRWLLIPESEHPGGPGRLVRVDSSVFSCISTNAFPISQAVVIRAGDRLLLEAHTSTADTWLSAIALGPACPGAPFLARLTLDNSIVRVVAIAPGRAIFLAPAGDESKGWAQ